MYTFICNCMYISTSYYRVLVQELRVFRPRTLASAAALRRVVPEFRVNLHELNRVAEF